jgi:hypothetical protein
VISFFNMNERLIYLAIKLLINGSTLIVYPISSSFIINELNIKIWKGETGKVIE